MSGAHVRDIPGVAAVDMVVLKFRREGTRADLLGMNEAPETIAGKLAVHDKPGALDKSSAH